ncbi:MAG TPA: LemA family protein [Steroidobacteraceae bacterium]|jgi:LemA protein|nr:LemA family protein [Steroidobacteraceae bacterium]
MAFGVVVALFVALLVWAALVYNSLVRDRNRVAQAWSDVDVQLTRRHELVPRLVEIVKGYASYERALLTSLAGLRSVSQGTPASRSETERAVSAGVQKLIALVEAYPNLKASEGFADLHRKLVDTENQIQYSRRYYNGAVNLFNNRLQRFPDLLIARAFAFRPAEFFELDEPDAAAAPKVALP